MRRLVPEPEWSGGEGFGEWDLDAFLWGDWYGDDEIGDWRRERQRSWPSWLAAPRRSLSAEEFVYLRATDHTPR
jgi:hypothetical protein